MARRPQQSEDNQPAKPRLEIWLAFAFGVIFAGILLCLATIEKNPTPLAIRVYVTILALSGGGIGAILPGFLEIKYKNFVRAGGAIGLTVLIYLNEPAIGRNVVNFVEPKAAAEPVATVFLSAIDSGDPNKSWEMLSAAAKNQLNDSEASWTRLYKTDISPLGPVQSRTLIGQGRADSPAGAPPGLYRWYSYKTQYTHDTGPRLENVLLRATPNDTWEVFSYQISPTTLPSA